MRGRNLDKLSICPMSYRAYGKQIAQCLIVDQTETFHLSKKELDDKLRTVHEPPYRWENGGGQDLRGFCWCEGALLFCQAELALLNDHLKFTASRVRQAGTDRVC